MVRAHGAGRDAARLWLKNNPEQCAELDEGIRTKLREEGVHASEREDDLDDLDDLDDIGDVDDFQLDDDILGLN